MKKEEHILYIVVPCFNEEEAINTSIKKLLEKRRELIHKKYISEESKIVFVDDGSTDATWEILKETFEVTPEIVGLRLATNKGHQNALLAGLMYAKEYCDFSITIDADLQQDINAMELFIEQYKLGHEIVYGVRNTRNTDSMFKKTTAKMFYSFMSFLGCNIYKNAADYRLMGKKSLESLSQYMETNLFLRGIIPEMGFSSSIVHFEVFPRKEGQSKYSFAKMLTLAMDGITSFSVKPIRIVLLMGVISLFVSVGMIAHVFYEYYFGYTETGWSSILASLWGIGGMILISQGIIGEYVGRCYMESKARPRYFISEILEENKK